jgi:multiple sugar transport system substrate-binding protein
MSIGKSLIHLTILLFLLILFNSCTSNKEELVIWIGGAPQEVNYWEGVVNSFNDKYGYDLRLIRHPTDSEMRRQALVTSLKAKQPDPDLFLMDIVWIKQFVQSDWLEPLDKYIYKSAFPTEVFFPNIINVVNKYEDTFYSLPVFMDVALLYYRADLLNKYGYGNPPSTWKELLAYAEKIQSGERKQNQNFNGYIWQGAQYEGLVCNFLEFAASNGGGIRSDDEYILNSQENIEALQFMQDLIHKYGVSPRNTFTEMKEEEVRSSFQRGNALFQRNWTYAWSLHNSEDSFVKNKTGITILPHFNGSSSVSTLGGWSIALSRFSDSKEAAWKFMEYVTSYEVQKEMVKALGWNPGRRDLYKDQDILDALPHFGKLEEVFKSIVLRPDIAYYPQVSAVIQRLANETLAGKLAPAEALSRMQKEIEELSAFYDE